MSVYQWSPVRERPAAADIQIVGADRKGADFAIHAHRFGTAAHRQQHRVFGKRREPQQRRMGAAAQVIAELAFQYPDADTIHLVMDNLSSHSRKSVTDLYGDELGGEIWDRFTVHYTPTHGSWLNQAEIEIGLFSRQCLGTRRIPDLKTLRHESRAWNCRMNRDRIKINWRFDRKAARRKFRYTRKSFKRS